MRCSLELSPERKPLERAQAMFYMAFEAANGDAERLEPSWETIKVPV